MRTFLWILRLLVVGMAVVVLYRWTAGISCQWQEVLTFGLVIGWVVEESGVPTFPDNPSYDIITTTLWAIVGAACGLAAVCWHREMWMNVVSIAAGAVAILVAICSIISHHRRQRPRPAEHRPPDWDPADEDDDARARQQACHRQQPQPAASLASPDRMPWE